MSKFLVIGDIHQDHKTADKYIKNWDGPIIFLGDYFDQFHDNPEQSAETAQWLKNSLQHPNRIHLIGNHDFHYMLPFGNNIFCSGYSPEKHQAINNILTKEDWNKLKYFHAEDNCWFSHAGISYKWFSHPIHGVTTQEIEEVISKAKIDIEGQIYNGSNFLAIWGADFYRGGRFDKGGLVWCDWRNLDFFKDIVQVVGHTPREEVKCHFRKGGTNINVDTHLKECIILDTETNKFEVIAV